MDRRTFIAASAAWLGSSSHAAAFTAEGTSFPSGFLWGAATAGHQVEGNNTNSDVWFVEHVQPTIFAEPSGDGVNSFELWQQDLELVRSIGLNTYRFSLEWARIEPEEGFFSQVMLDHYKALIDGCRARGITPMVTFNHFSSPRWFAAKGGWTHAGSADAFARFCERAARHLSSGMGYATTLNEPQILRLLKWMNLLPPAVIEQQRAMLIAAARATGSDKFVVANAANAEDLDVMQTHLIAAHKAGKAAIKAVRPDLPVGVSLALQDDQAVGSAKIRDAKRDEVYAAWLEVAKDDDFVGVQNYERARYDAQGAMPIPPNAARNGMGGEIYAPSLAGAVRYAYEVTRRPIMITEHGLAADDDSQRAAFIPAALAELHKAMQAGIPVLGYVHWSLLDNFEWVMGYRVHYGLASVDRTTFERTLKPSARVLGNIARKNSL